MDKHDNKLYPTVLDTALKSLSFEAFVIYHYTNGYLFLKPVENFIQFK